MAIVSEELIALDKKYGDERRSEIVGDASSLEVEDLIADEEMVITVSRQGYVKRAEIDTYRAQRRGGRGLQGMGTKEEDWVEHLFVASAHEYLMIFTRSGQCHWLKVWQVPPAGRHSRGKPIVNLLNIDPADEIASIVPVREFSDDHCLLFCTKAGKVKKTALSAYGNVRQVGIIGINVREGGGRRSACPRPAWSCRSRRRRRPACSRSGSARRRARRSAAGDPIMTRGSDSRP